MNNDSRLDLVIANEGTDGIGVLFGFNYTTFQRPVIHPSNDSLVPDGMVVSDFNNDGSLDIVTVPSVSHKIGIYLGCGNGSFTLIITYSIGNEAEPFALTVSDLNSDGRADIVMSDVGTHSIAILFGYGTGSFAPVKKYSSGGFYPTSVAVGDMNNDDLLDLVVANYYSDNVGVLLGYGNGTFSTVQLYLTVQYLRPQSIVLSDMDNDGRLDLVISTISFDDTAVSIRYGTRAARDQVIPLTIANSEPTRVAVADFNNDNRLDIVVENYNNNQFRIILSCENRTFAPSVDYSTGLNSQPSSLEVGDFNNDSILDIAVVTAYAYNIVILFGIGDGTFLAGRPYLIDTDSVAIVVVIGDFNSDTRLDISVSNNYGNNIVVFLGTGSEPFGSLTAYTTDDGSRPYSVAAGDVNNDHQMDIVVANYGTNNIGVLLGRSDRKFTPITTYPTGPGSAPYCVALADFNNDTYLDIVVTTSETDSIVIFFGDGDGTFATSRTYSTGYRSRPYTLVISDFNNDHKWDIAVANSGTSNILLLYGSGNGTFGTEISFSLGYGYHPYSIAVIDMNSDGWMDIVVACYDTDHIETFIQMC